MFIHLQNPFAYFWRVRESLGRIKEDLLKLRKKSSNICTEGREGGRGTSAGWLKAAWLGLYILLGEQKLSGIQVCSPEPPSSWKCWFLLWAGVITPTDSWAQQNWGRICGKEKAAYILLSLGGGSEGFSLITGAAPNLSFPSTCLLQGLSSDNEEWHTVWSASPI